MNNNSENKKWALYFSRKKKTIFHNFKNNNKMIFTKD